MFILVSQLLFMSTATIRIYSAMPLPFEFFFYEYNSTQRVEFNFACVNSKNNVSKHNRIYHADTHKSHFIVS